MTPLRAVVAREAGQPADLEEADEELLGLGEVTVAVRYSSLNYKDALAVSASAPVVRRYPLICGIDLVGEVIESVDPSLPAGSEVFSTGFGLGEEHSGGFSNLARLPSSWCLPCPASLGPVGTMALGTAGLTAMLAAMALERNGATPERLGDRAVAVSGATGGVGILATLVLSRLGYRVVASTGHLEMAGLLAQLGADEVIGHEELLAGRRGPLAAVRFGSAVDVVGGNVLADLLTQTAPGGVVAACGLVGGPELPSTVFPFILRGVTLAGISSPHPDSADRVEAWTRLSQLLSRELLEPITEIHPLSEVFSLARRQLDGNIQGRIVLDTNR